MYWYASANHQIHACTRKSTQCQGLASSTKTNIFLIILKTILYRRTAIIKNISKPLWFHVKDFYVSNNLTFLGASGSVL